jgi:biotin carboxylase
MKKNILFIAGLVGPKFDYALPRIAKHGNIYSYVLRKLSNERYKSLQQYSEQIFEGRFLTSTHSNQNELTQEIINIAKRIKADAIVALDEFSIAPASHAAVKLGLRGAGKYIELSRNKFAMREAFKANNVPSPHYRLIINKNDLIEACEILKFPFLLKVTEGAGSLANVLVHNEQEALSTYHSLCKLVLNLGRTCNLGIVDSFLTPEFIAEELINSTTESWYDVPGYGDYVSVEGMVIDGNYHPISITSRMPTIYPFVETAIQAPCVLLKDLQYKIADMAKAAVDALKLEYCATHTEIKLLANRQLCLIESAARVPGASIVKVMEDSFEIDIISLLVESLLTGSVQYLPNKLITDYKKASGAVAILSTDASGQPWKTQPLFTQEINWRSILPEAINFEVEWVPSLENGTTIPFYDPEKGQFNYLGGVLMTCDDPALLIKGQHDILNLGESLFLETV